METGWQAELGSDKIQLRVKMRDHFSNLVFYGSLSFSIQSGTEPGCQWSCQTAEFQVREKWMALLWTILEKDTNSSPVYGYLLK